MKPSDEPSQSPPEGASRDPDDLFAKVFRLSPDSVVVTRMADRTVVHANEALCRMWGGTLDEVIGKPTKEFSVWVSATERQTFMDQLLRDGEVLDWETHMHMADDRLLRMRVSSRILTLKGEECILSVLRDVTEKWKVEEQVRAQQKLLQTVFDNMAEGVAVLGTRLNVVHINPAFRRLFGVPEPMASWPEFMAGLDVFVPGGRALQPAEYPSYRAQRGEFVHDFEMGVRKKGTTEDTFAEFTTAPIAAAADGSAQFVITVRDVTERRWAEAEVKLREARLRATLDNMMEGCQIIGRDWRYLYLNTLAASHGRREVHELLGRTMMEAYPGIEATPMFAALERCMEARIPCSLENTFEYPGEPASTFLLEVLPAPEGVLVLSLDVTERRRSERAVQELNADLERRVRDRTAELEAVNGELRASQSRIESLFESLPGLYLVLSPDFTIVAVSDAYLRATMTTRAGIMGRGIFDVFPDNPADLTADGVSNLRASLTSARESAEAHTMAIQKYDVRRPDGTFEVRYWSPINSPVLGKDRRVEYLVHRVEDVTDFMRQKEHPEAPSAALLAQIGQMEAEVYKSSQNLHQANGKLETANRELEAFSYSVSHDLRAPLRSIDGFAHAVVEDYAALLPEDGRRFLKTISESARRMGALIDDLLKFSRLSRQPLSRHAVAAGEQVRLVLAELARPAAAAEVMVGTLPDYEGDPALVRQVWVNLLSNALKYSAKREHPRIEVGSCEAQGETIYFVRDNGAGFDMRYAHKLFGVFQRLHRLEDYEGTGVGLAVAQRIVHRHGGRIWAEAEPDRGATFRFTLAPRAEAPRGSGQ